MLTAIKKYIEHLYFNDKDNTIFEVYNNWYGDATCDDINEVLDDENFLAHLIEDIGIENIEESLRDWGYEKVVEIYKLNPYRKLIAKGDSLKSACINWDCLRTNSEDIWQAYKASPYYKEDNLEAFYEWRNSITGEELFEIMRDGNYNYYLEEWEIC